jgi:hypothetical protein
MRRTLVLALTGFHRLRLLVVSARHRCSQETGDQDTASPYQTEWVRDPYGDVNVPRIIMHAVRHFDAARGRSGQHGKCSIEVGYCAIRLPTDAGCSHETNPALDWDALGQPYVARRLGWRTRLTDASSRMYDSRETARSCWLIEAASSGILDPLDLSPASRWANRVPSTRHGDWGQVRGLPLRWLPRLLLKLGCGGLAPGRSLFDNALFSRTVNASRRGLRWYGPVACVYVRDYTKFRYMLKRMKEIGTGC